jgi:hypothetical protein
MIDRALLLAALVLAPSSALADDLWVAMDGVDEAGRGAEATPLASIRYAATVASAGDRVLVREGDYAGFHVGLEGTVDAPIEFVAMGTVRITSENDFTNRDGINVEGASYVVIEGFTVQGMERAGLRAVESDHVTFRGNTASANGTWGIFTGCVPDMTIEDNVTSGSIDDHGIYHSNSCDRPVIRRNVTFDNNANGIHMNGDDSIECMTGDSDGVISEAIVEENVIYGNGVAGGSGINCDGVADSIIQSNLIYDTHASGISLYRIDAGGPARGNHVINNTIVVAPDGRWAVNIRDGATDTVVRNNIMLTDHAFRGAIALTEDSMAGFDSDHNVVVPRLSPDGGDATVLDLEEWQALGHDGHSIVATPEELFVDAASGDFRLRDGSPGIDAGDPGRFAERTVDGALRDDAPDIGAYEHGSLGPSSDAGAPDAGADAGPDDPLGPDAGARTDGGFDGAVEMMPRPDASSRDATSAGAPGDDGGCACRAAPRRETPALAPAVIGWLVLGVTAARRRRGTHRAE